MPSPPYETMLICVAAVLELNSIAKYVFKFLRRIEIMMRNHFPFILQKMLYIND